MKSFTSTNANFRFNHTQAAFLKTNFPVFFVAIVIVQLCFTLLACSPKTTKEEDLGLVIENPAFQEQGQTVIRYGNFSSAMGTDNDKRFFFNNPKNKSYFSVRCQKQAAQTRAQDFCSFATSEPSDINSDVNSTEHKKNFVVQQDKNFFVLQFPFVSSADFLVKNTISPDKKINTKPNNRTFLLFASLPLDAADVAKIQELPLSYIFLMGQESSTDPKDVEKTLLLLETRKPKSIFVFFAPLPTQNSLSNYRYYIVTTPYYFEQPNNNFSPMIPIFYFAANIRFTG